MENKTKTKRIGFVINPQEEIIIKQWMLLTKRTFSSYFHNEVMKEMTKQISMIKKND